MENQYRNYIWLQERILLVWILPWIVFLVEGIIFARSLKEAVNARLKNKKQNIIKKIFAKN